MATHSSIVAWRIQWTGEPVHRVGHNRNDLAHTLVLSGSLYYDARDRKAGFCLLCSSLYPALRTAQQLTKCTTCGFHGVKH